MAELFGDSAPDVVVYNAGIARDNMFVFMSPEEWDSVIHTNLDGFYHTVQPLLFGMIARRSGRIIVITSASGQSGQAGQVNYAASKAGIIGLTKSTAKELASRGVTCNAIAPGFVETDMTAVLKEDVQEAILNAIPLKRAGKVEDIARAAVFLAENNYITGQVLNVDGGMVM